jgi:hypothetical protein
MHAQPATALSTAEQAKAVHAAKHARAQNSVGHALVAWQRVAMLQFAWPRTDGCLCKIGRSQGPCSKAKQSYCTCKMTACDGSPVQSLRSAKPQALEIYTQRRCKTSSITSAATLHCTLPCGGSMQCSGIPLTAYQHNLHHCNNTPCRQYRGNLRPRVQQSTQHHLMYKHSNSQAMPLSSFPPAEAAGQLAAPHGCKHGTKSQAVVQHDPNKHPPSSITATHMPCSSHNSHAPQPAPGCSSPRFKSHL